MKTLRRNLVAFGLMILALGACRKESQEAPSGHLGSLFNGHFGTARLLNVAGQVMDANGIPISGATVSAGFGSQSTITDGYGAFVLNGIDGYEKLGYVRVAKAGYFEGSRSFIPKQGLNVVRVVLLAKTIVGTIAGATGGAIAVGGVVLELPANGYERDGVPYDGQVQIALQHVDPSDESMFDRMPGSLIGSSEGAVRMLRSFGMITVELMDDNGLPVDLAEGSSAVIHFPVPGPMLVDAPVEIDLWYFDELIGHWSSDGEATLQGAEYVAEVGHFSWWNCDLPINYVHLNGRVTVQGSSLPLANAKVLLNTQSLGQGVDHSNADGYFGGVVPAGEALNLSINLDCDGSELTLYSLDIDPLTSDLFLTVTVPVVSLGSLATVSGNVSDCNGDPVMAGYVIEGDGLHFLTEGAYVFQTCVSPVMLSAYDQLNQMWSAVVPVSLAAGQHEIVPLQACDGSSGPGQVSDIDGNVYQTVVLGMQEWMASNLRVRHYANGDLISEPETPQQWELISTGALNESEYFSGNLAEGLHYNWYAVQDSRNVCPSGWHVPTEDDWQGLELLLGISQAELDDEFVYRGTSVNAGGKLKSTDGTWLTPNLGATNESLFSGLPSGVIDTLGFEHEHGQFAHYWTGTTSAYPSFAWARNLAHNSTGIGRFIVRYRAGYSIRCIRD